MADLRRIIVSGGVYINARHKSNDRHPPQQG